MAFMDINDIACARREQLLKELASDLNDLVESGDMTANEANEWFNTKADQWL
jgi:hypothetical protein